MQPKNKNTKKIIKNNSLPSMQDLLVDTIVHVYDFGFKDFGQYYKENVKEVYGLKNLSWEKVITLGKANIAVIIDSIKTILTSSSVKVTYKVCGKVGSSDKDLRSMKNQVLRKKYQNALKKLQVIAAQAEYKPLLPWFRTPETYTDQTLMMYYSDVLGWWDICAIRGWHQVLSMVKGYRYMPSTIEGIRQGAIHQGNYSLFMDKESNKLLSREEIEWFESHSQDTEFIKLWFDTSNDLGSTIKNDFQTLDTFMDTITNNGAPDLEFSVQRHQIAHANYSMMRRRYEAA